MSGSEYIGNASSSGIGRPSTTADTLSIRLVATSNDHGQIMNEEDSSEGGESDIMQQFHQDVIEKMTNSKDMSERTRERKKWTLTNELRKITQGVNLKYDQANRRNAGGAENPHSSGYRKVAGKVETTSLMPPIASGKSKSSSFVSKSECGDVQTVRAAQLEDDLQLNNLVELMKVFHENEEKGSNGMNITEFQQTMARILGEEGDPRVTSLFLKIDVDSVGKVNWEKFCNYIVREYQERQLMHESLTKDLYKDNINVIYSLARDFFVRITFLPVIHRKVFVDGHVKYISEAIVEGGTDKAQGRFLSLTRDGHLQFWQRNFTLSKTVWLDVGKLPWVTDMVVLPNCSRVIVSLANNTLKMFDISCSKCELLTTIINIPFTIISMDYWYDLSKPNIAILLMGDMQGGVGVLEFKKALVFLFGPQIGCNRILTFKDIFEHRVIGTTWTYYSKLHRDWVTKVRYWGNIHFALSCSNDSQKSLHLLDLSRNRGSVIRLRKGVNTFDYCSEWGIIATGGLDRDIRIWNPYVTNRPITTLRGHITSIMQIVINSRNGHIFSLSKDLEFRVWNIGDYKCVQLRKFSILHPKCPTAFYVHPYTEVVMVATGSLGVLEPSVNYHDKFVCSRAFSHSRPLCGALYNDIFDQVVSACQGSEVCVWDITTGEKVIQFSKCHGDVEITAMSFDSSGKQLLTGGRDGSIKAWNFNNGENIMVLKNDYIAEITGICCLRKRVVVGGWSRILNYYTHSRLPLDYSTRDTIPEYFGHNCHKEDILCMCYMEPNMVASGDYNGDIITWNLDVNRMTSKMNAAEIGRKTPKNFSKLKKKSPSQIWHDVMQERHPAGSRAIEKMVFLEGRSLDKSSANLISCGVGGWVDFWNIHGGGLLGEFNVWDNNRHSLPEMERFLHTVTALRVNAQHSILYTGNSVGYIQVWKIASYCFKIPEETKKPILSSPPLSLCWRAHDRGIVSIDITEGKQIDLLISASLDHCVRLWTLSGRYIGTFGEKNLWDLATPRHTVDLPHKIPHGLNRCASVQTLTTVSGPSTSKWKQAKILFEHYQVEARRKKRVAEQALERGKKLRWELDSVQEKREDKAAPILGRGYQRVRRFRKPIVPPKLTRLGNRFTFNVYDKLDCTPLVPNVDVQMPDCFHKGHFVPIPALLPSERNNTMDDHPTYKTRRLRKPFTEISILPDLKLRDHDGKVKDKKNCKSNKPHYGYRRLYRKFLDGTEGQWLRVLNDDEKQDSPNDCLKILPHSADVKSENLFPAVNNRGLLGNA